LNRSRIHLKRLLTPVTILMVPHGRTRPVSIRLPVLALLASACLFLVGTSFVAIVSVRALEYHRMEARLSYLSEQFREMKGVMLSLRRAESDFRRMFGVKSKAAVLESTDPADSGSLDMKALRGQIEASMRSVTEIRTYIKEQKDLHRATPAGWPLPGRLSSPYGNRRHPVHDEPRMHTGLDISAPPGSEVTATADGVVSFAGWTEGGGIVVVVEHGHGFRTAYAHNVKAMVRVGQRVARGEPVAVSGSTGLSTGPHVHYEVWKNGRHADPAGFPAGS
jgi:murein DD-endopeptidase MepM/ murein hydrolase activator NlpD